MAVHNRKAQAYKLLQVEKDQVSLDAMEADLTPGRDDMSKAINVMACRQAVAKALSILDERSRSVVVLRCLKGLSPDETAKRLALTPGNVRVIQSRAIGKMSKFLEDSDFSPEDFFS